jgi:hypothetical protein
MTRHTVDTIRGSRAKVDTRPEADTKSSQRSRREDVVTQSTKGVIVTKSIKWGLLSQEGNVVTKPTRGRYTVDRRGCRHQVDRRSSHSRPMELPSASRQKVRGHQVNPAVGTPSQPKERRHQVNPGVGTPSQPKERGHQVNPQKKGADTQSTQEM